MPDQPNPLTPAIGRSAASSVGASTGWTVPSAGIAAAGSVVFRLPGAILCSSSSTVLISPATPAADWVCPTLVFTAPTRSGLSARPGAEHVVQR